LVWSVRGYQRLVSPALPRSCKYHPSCSHYAIEALTEYGVLRGVVLASWRLLRCNPLSYGGYDPVENQTLFASRATDERAPGGSGVGSSPRSCACSGADGGMKLRTGRDATPSAGGGATVGTGRAAGF
jgi:putative membrane protein insertion efficiency factor